MKEAGDKPLAGRTESASEAERVGNAVRLTDVGIISSIDAIIYEASLHVFRCMGDMDFGMGTSPKPLMDSA